MSFDWVLFLNIVATIIWIIMLVPQAYRTIKTKDTHSISVFMFLLYPVANILWITNTIIVIEVTHNFDNIGVLITDSCLFILSSIIASIKIINMRKAKKLKISELEYYNKCILGKKENKLILKTESLVKNMFKKKEKST